ncbi:hypothetical protein C5B97_09005 [Pseudoclavibacter sp. RFBB5]|nr:hypothetical protein C5B97_09005 [Pseudoclavibacter sp. RFBB5]
MTLVNITIDQLFRQLREAREPAPRPLTRLEWVLLSVATAALFAVSVSILGAVYNVRVGLAFGLAVLTAAGLLLAPIRPRIAILLHLAGIALLPFPYAIYIEAWPLPVPQLISLSLLVGIITLRDPDARGRHLDCQPHTRSRRPRVHGVRRHASRRGR